MGDKISREVACRVRKGVGMIGVRVIMILIHGDRYNAARGSQGVLIYQIMSCGDNPPPPRDQTGDECSYSCDSRLTVWKSRLLTYSEC